MVRFILCWTTVSWMNTLVSVVWASVGVVVKMVQCLHPWPMDGLLVSTCTLGIPDNSVQGAKILFNPNGFWTEHTANNKEINYGCSIFRNQCHLTGNISIYRWHLCQWKYHICSTNTKPSSGYRLTEKLKKWLGLYIWGESTVCSVGSMKSRYQNQADRLVSPIRITK